MSWRKGKGEEKNDENGKNIRYYCCFYYSFVITHKFVPNNNFIILILLKGLIRKDFKL